MVFDEEQQLGIAGGFMSTEANAAPQKLNSRFLGFRVRNSGDATISDGDIFSYKVPMEFRIG